MLAALPLGLAAAAMAATYEYDALGRLTHVAHDDGSTVTYTYDLNGNRTQVVTTGSAEFTVNDASVTEGGDLVFTVTRTGTTGVSHSLDYATTPGTASASDFTGASGTLTFASGETAKTVTIATVQDAVFEAGETVFLDLSNAAGGAAIADGQGAGTITNDDPAPSFSVDDVSIVEGGPLTFTVTKTGSTEVTHSVSYATADGTAIAGSEWSDYTAASGVLSFAAGETAKTVTVLTTQEVAYEDDETLVLNLSSATNGATIADDQGTGTILNDDTPPTFAIGNVSVAEGGDLVFTVTKAGPATQAHEIGYATANGTAAASDYTAASGSVIFGVAETTKTITVATVQDAVFEASETVLVNLTPVTPGTIISDGQGAGTIANDDAAPAFSVNNVSVAEGGNLVFTVTRSGATAFSHNVSYATANGTANWADYTAASGTLTFAAGETTKTVTVATTQDAYYEASKTVLLNLSNATNGATISDSQGVGAITNNDPPPSFSVNNVSVAEGGSLVFTVTKSGATGLSHNVTYATANGTAAAGSDYVATSGVLTFAWNQTTATVTVPTAHDTAYEANETLSLNLSAPTNNATIADSQGIGTINNNDQPLPPTAQITGYSNYSEYQGNIQVGYFIANITATDPHGGTTNLNNTPFNYGYIYVVYSGTPQVFPNCNSPININVTSSSGGASTYRLTCAVAGTASLSATLTLVQ